ncbi:hypothetical protein [Flavobacterium caeni]|uniref:Uncharacterized protein n=1 Tax=Flavobacterium caeni TaxID=490189 RepID=A0A1G5KMP1_9FLAO|nr:hypothetical protein [Flavobacterium caeni]SCZ01340.1 hypothetical protein SAMN02927903_03364 [Flavobacterium caeni]
MKKGTHGIDEKTFEGLTYADQAKSLNAQIQIIEKALKAHFRKGEIESKDINISKVKYKLQLSKIVDSLQ